MMVPYTQPKFSLKAFNCPHCQAFADQHWVQAYFNPSQDPSMLRAVCSHCKNASYWHNKIMVYPDSTGFPPPNPDLGSEIVEDYLEAASISSRSPRGGAALLRLGIQKLCVQLGEKGKNINDDIAELVKKGLSPKVQMMLDVVRVVGNNAVHPGQIDLKDNSEIVNALARLINEICSEMITKPRELEELYASLPEAARQGIEARDKKNKNP